MAGKFIENVIEFLNTLYNIEGPTVKTPKVKKMLVDERFKNVIPYLVMRKFIKITWKDENNKDVSPENISHVHLRDEGVEYLINYKNMNAQKEFNRMIALTGCVIALVYIYGFLKTFFEIDSGGVTWLSVVFLFLVIFCFIPIIVFVIRTYLREI